MINVTPGWRIKKTILGLVLILIPSHFFNIKPPFYALIALVLVMKDSYEKSLTYAKGRISGTLLGGSLGYLVLRFSSKINLDVNGLMYKIMVLFAAYCALMICKKYKFSESASAITLILLLASTFLHNSTTQDAFFYVFYRVIETVIGIIIGILLNGVDLKKEQPE